MFRTILCSLLLAVGQLYAQSTTTVAPEGATALHLSALFSSVEIITGDGPNIEIDHMILIDGRARAELSELQMDRQGGVLRIAEAGPTQEQLEPEMRRVSTVINGRRTSGYDDRHMELALVVTVPENLPLTIETVYGSVNVIDHPGLREVKATYGGVDVIYSVADALPEQLTLYSNYGTVDLTLPPGVAARLELITEFGELLTDFDLLIDREASERRDFYEHIVSTVGSGPAATSVKCTAPYGKVYVRRGRGGG
ncbi:hypothetical protein [Lewinella sp. JB7]|uniref:hypothetical protein n=1 Tax=Lewinella sp. JB7 TaxID=2962887 RepID=UPI0020C9BA22|nr:hypothetical protein [Lewinella sp. JB7]MCP9236904.1 hypothetical protein [Lewinella sp. JB7]